MKFKLAGAIGLLVLQFFSNLSFGALDSPQVTLLRAPDAGIQPQAAVDAKGVAHLIYYRGAAEGGDIFYSRLQPGQIQFSKGIPVNSHARSAVALGTIRGAQLAVETGGRVHVVWNGSSGTARAVVRGQEVTPLLYTRLNDVGLAFEPERNLITSATGLDGGASVAAHGAGNVYVVWHGRPPQNTKGDAGRAVFVARSKDAGKTFAPETPAVTNATGACSCCSLRAFAEPDGRLGILYRAAGEDIHRDEILLVSKHWGEDFEMTTVDKWNASTCPMSSGSLARSTAGLLAAWETAGQVYFARIENAQISNPTCPPGSARRKHPVVVANQSDKVLLAWTEGTGWGKGGAVAWQVYDAKGNATSEKGRMDGVPVWSLVTAFARPDGSFVIVY